jgi:3-oxoadipate enol-lactonase/4-carboxymuconolactone decarboxylase
VRDRCNAPSGGATAIRGRALLDKIPQITVPTVLVAGALDIRTRFVGHGDKLVAAIAQTTLVELGAAHLSPIENPQGFALAIRRFAVQD